jgi:hypothetical protein
MKRWAIIRHIRYFYLLYQVNRHYELWMKLGMLPVNIEKDYAHLDKIWSGEV